MNTTTAHGRAAAAAAIVSDGEGTWFATIPGETVRIRVAGERVGGRYSVVESLALPMTGTPMHTHAEDEVFHVLEGVLTFDVAGKRFEAAPGMLVAVPRTVPHAWRNFGDGPTRAMVVFTPGGIETLFPQLENLPHSQVAALARQYGSAVVGPPIER